MARFIPRRRPDGPGAPLTPQQRQRVEALNADLLSIFEESKRAGAVVEVSSKASRLTRSTNDLFEGRTRGGRPVGRTRSRSASPSRGDGRESRCAQRSGVLWPRRTRSRSAGPEAAGERAGNSSSKELARSNTFSVGSFRAKGGQRRELTEKDPASDTIGTKWVDCGFFRPQTGAELQCDLLAATLPRQREFTPAELAVFQLGEKLRYGSYVKARDGRFFKPEAVFEDEQRFKRLPFSGVWDWLKHNLSFKIK